MLQQAALQFGLEPNDYFPDETSSERIRIRPADLRAFSTRFNQLCQDSGEPLFPAFAAKHVSPLTFSCYSLALWTGNDLNTFIQDACQYCILIGSPIRLKHHITPKGNSELWVINHDPFNDKSKVSDRGFMMYVATLIEMIQQATGGVDKLTLKITRWPFPQPLQPQFEQLMGCQIKTGSPILKICFPSNAREIRLKGRDPNIYSVTIPPLRQAVSQLESHDIILLIYKLLDNEPNLKGISREKIAAEMLMSVRTLNRRLAFLGSSYRQVLEQYKLEKALLLISQPNINLTDIAFRLGFADLSSFSRAFKGWTGHSPTHFL
ncbi:helix-turn-helix domain-containing protein [Photobacterium sp. BZF1]|uniref:helix-turn-helix domain-containing protein n=1 Tax=Photobacterium sp. BZF1 TaxID=1904457 RepID=UPI001653B77D|nr:helix-turn-helix domain-containing protein [Photobacterium sp. BZF1]MBC7005689.1 helix-turn-helix domain-containing protein [Photobacterium sp. BZF1]